MKPGDRDSGAPMIRLPYDGELTYAEFAMFDRACVEVGRAKAEVIRSLVVTWSHVIERAKFEGRR